jgi:hypothetical protein
MYPSDKDNIKKYFYILNDTVSTDVYQRHYTLTDDMKLDMDIRSALIEAKLAEVKKKRDILIANLDLPFLKAVEARDEDMRDHITDLKNDLRDLPQKLRFAEIETEVEIANYDPFGNLFLLALVDGGSGYQTVPKVTIDPPRPSVSSFGFRAEAVALIENSKVVDLRIIDGGCGYDFVPMVTVDPPENGEQAVAGCAYPQHTMLTEKQIIHNSEAHYDLS